jgi:hypothetical protein
MKIGGKNPFYREVELLEKFQKKLKLKPETFPDFFSLQIVF